MDIFRQKPDPLEIRLRNSGFGQIKVWFPTVIAIAVIAIESTPNFGAQHTSDWLRPYFETIFGHIADDKWELFHHYLRKTGHFVGYGLVCLAFLRSWLLTFAAKVDLSRNAWRTRASVAAILSTAVIASLDEWHQTMLSNRTGRFLDVVLDTCGASTIVLLVWLLVWRRQTSRRRRTR